MAFVVKCFIDNLNIHASNENWENFQSWINNLSFEPSTNRS